MLVSFARHVDLFSRVRHEIRCGLTRRLALIKSPLVRLHVLPPHLGGLGIWCCFRCMYCLFNQQLVVSRYQIYSVRPDDDFCRVARSDTPACNKFCE